MCGISGIVSLGKSKISSQVLKEMTDIISHRGPDGFGYYYSEDVTVAFGHRRLSVIDLSDNAKQPMVYKDLTITYNGEIYNYIELRNELILKGYSFNSESDTEVILASYDLWGAEMVDKLNGMWAFALHDLKRNIIFISRDRFGIKPLYYTVYNNSFYFGSEIKQFTVLENWVSILNKPRAIDFLLHGYINHTDETLFRNVNELRGGYNITIDLKTYSIVKMQYYDLRAKGSINNRQDPNPIKKFKEIFTDAINLSLRSDVKVGTALSGGLDSTAIASVIKTLLKKKGNEIPQECVSACFTESEFDESEYVNEVENYLNIRVHKVNPTWIDFIASYEKLIWHQDEPFSTLSIFAQYCVFQTAKKFELTVMLDGQGADEILAGYDNFYVPYFKNIFKKNPFLGIYSLFNYLIKHKIYPTNNILKNLKISNKIKFIKDSFLTDENSYCRPQDKTIVTCSLNHMTSYGLHSLLRYEDRNSMAFSIESRVPFLDFRLVEFCLQLDDKYKIKYSIRKYLLRESLKELLPNKIYKRNDKNGFLSPQELWTRKNISFFNDELDRAISSNKLVFEETALKKIRDLLKRNDKEAMFVAWKIICFNKWMEVFKVAI